MNVKFEFPIGDTYTRNIVIRKYSDDIDEFYFTIKNNYNDKKFVLQKTLNNGITLADVKTEGGVIVERTYNLLIQPSDTEVLRPEVEYVFDMQINTPVLSGEDIKLTIVRGTCVLTNVVTRAYNEGSDS